MKHITIKDIALELGISVSTVSRALNDHPDIHETTKLRVGDVEKKLGYRPNFIAKNLKFQQDLYNDIYQIEWKNNSRKD